MSARCLDERETKRCDLSAKFACIGIIGIGILFVSVVWCLLEKREVRSLLHSLEVLIHEQTDCFS